jgi:hypothetical protein
LAELAINPGYWEKRFVCIEINKNVGDGRGGRGQDEGEKRYEVW